MGHLRRARLSRARGVRRRRRGPRDGAPAGTTMLDDLEAKPWRVDRHADTWATLHRRLAQVPVGDLATAGVATRFGPPDAVLHLDFHPDNIMLTPDGPVVFDWTNAALGPPAADVALRVAHRGDVHGRRLAVDAGRRPAAAPPTRRPVRRPLRAGRPPRRCSPPSPTTASTIATSGPRKPTASAPSSPASLDPSVGAVRVSAVRKIDPGTRMRSNTRIGQASARDR